MKPKEIIIEAINAHLKQFLSDHNFEFAQSQLSFRRKLKNGFIQELKFTGNLRNTENLIARFRISYMVNCPAYKTWWTRNFPEIPILGGGYIDTNKEKLKDMARVIKEGTEYDFLKHSPIEIMDEIKFNFSNYGLSFFEENESWEKLSHNAGSKLTEIDAQILSNQFMLANTNITETKKAFLDEYGGESNINGSARQVFDILVSRQNYLKDQL